MTKHDYQKRALVQALIAKGWTPTEIIQLAGVQRSFVYRWKDRKDFGRMPGSGRKPKLTDGMLVKIHRKLHRKRNATQRRIAKEVGLAQSTISSAAKQLGMHGYHPQKKTELTAEQKRKRVRFAKTYKDQDWSIVLYADEKSFLTGLQPNRKNYVIYAHDITEVPYVEKLPHPAKLNIAAAVSSTGRSELYIFRENLDAEICKKIMEDTILPAGAKLFGNTPWTLLHDNDPKFRSRTVTQYLESEEISFIPKDDWPANSPDLNPMDNVWSMLLDGLNERPPRSVGQLDSRLRSEWAKLPQQKILATINSMPNRLQAVIAASGGSTKY